MFAPDDYFLHLARKHGIAAALAEMRLMGSRHVYHLGHGIGALLARAVWEHAIPLAVKRQRPARWRSARQLAAASGLDPALVRDRQIVERIRQVWAKSDHFARLTPAQQHAAVLRPPGIVRGLEGYDRVGGRAGVEMRDPLADIRVLESLQRAPLSVRSAEGRTKWVGRAYVRQSFGDEVASRTDKFHLGAHLVVAALRSTSVAMVNEEHDQTDNGYAAFVAQRWQQRLVS
jgi:hypothetical protein